MLARAVGREAWRRAQTSGFEPVLLVRGPLRRHLSELLRSLKPPIPVLSFGEVLKADGIESVGLVQLDAQGTGTPDHAAVA